MKLLVLFLTLLSLPTVAADLTGHQLLVTSVRTGDNEVIIANPATGDPPSTVSIKPDGTDATLIESLHFQMAIDGSRASWKPTLR